MHTEPDDLARKLGYAGLIPFVGGTLFIWLLADREDSQPFMFMVRALSTYAALVAAFLGGIPWGLVMKTTPTSDAGSTPVSRALWTGIGYSLAAWIGVLMPPHAGLAWLGGLLIVCYVLDRRRYPELEASGWLTLRFRLSMVASLCCLLAAAQL